jgi:antitoxin component YwqK of YwqJK toxin-antitoxin module
MDYVNSVMKMENYRLKRNYIDAKEHGLCRELYENGQLQYEHRYINGESVKIEFYFLVILNNR